MNTIYFVTPGNIDLRAIRTFGLSAKEGENPIGFFGTGMKYALAILMREGAQVSMSVKRPEGTDSHTFRVVDDKFRNQDFKAVYLDDTLLPFTTELGKKWELWMAFRELYCNTIDENGTTTDLMEEAAVACSQYTQGYTIIEIQHARFYGVWQKKHEYFLEKEPTRKLGSVHVHEMNNNALFYKGIRAYDIQPNSMFTWNLWDSTELTEDRTIKYHFVVNNTIAYHIAKECDDIDFIQRVVSCPTDYWEAKIMFQDWVTPSEHFMKALKPLVKDFSGRLNNSARELYEKNCSDLASEFEYVSLTPVQEAMLEKAKVFCADMHVPLGDQHVHIVANLGGSVLGLSKNNQIYLTLKVFSMGTKMVAGTLYEELTHQAYGYEDMSRGFQNHLINTLVSMYEEYKGEPL